MKQICIVLIIALAMNSSAFAGGNLFRGLLGAAVIVGTVDAIKHHRPIYGPGYGYSPYRPMRYGYGYSGNIPMQPSYGCGQNYAPAYAAPIPVTYRKVVTPIYRYGQLWAEQIEYIPVYR